MPPGGKLDSDGAKENSGSILPPVQTPVVSAVAAIAAKTAAGKSKAPAVFGGR